MIGEREVRGRRTLPKRRTVLWIRIANLYKTATYVDQQSIAGLLPKDLGSGSRVLPRIIQLQISLVLIASWAITSVVAARSPAIYDSFETPTTRWQTESRGSSIESHQWTPAAARSGRGGEFLHIASVDGEAIDIGYSLAGMPVISEFESSVWIRSNAHGAQLLAEVQFPRTVDPRTGKPVTANVFGDAYTETGRWQRLQIRDVPHKVQRRAQLMRTQFGPHIDHRQPRLDHRGAIVSKIVLRLRPAGGIATISIDDLKVFGHAIDGIPAAASASRRERIGILMSDQRPLPPEFPRLFTYRGESLAALKAMGINCVLIAKSPPDEVLLEANATGMTIVCPPYSSSAENQPPSDHLKPIIGWYLGNHLTNEDCVFLAQQRRRMEQDSATRGRLMVGGSVSDHWQLSRVLDVLLTSPSNVATGSSLAAEIEYLAKIRADVRPGTDVWSNMRVDSNDAADVIADRALSVVAAGGKGICFEAPAPLTSASPLGAVLTQVNRRLELISPLVEKGVVESLRVELSGHVLSTLRSGTSRLLFVVPDNKAESRSPEFLEFADLPPSLLCAEVTPTRLDYLSITSRPAGDRFAVVPADHAQIFLVGGDSRTFAALSRRQRVAVQTESLPKRRAGRVPRSNAASNYKRRDAAEVR